MKESGNNVTAAQKVLKEKTKEILNKYYEMNQTARKIGEALS
ncbi:MAG TPA: hypothetical protein DCY12_00560 [Candidatus Atribacteria bacterium]|nr:hypothetical protein [Candidatus Atribacteria bacterium]